MTIKNYLRIIFFLLLSTLLIISFNCKNEMDQPDDFKKDREN